MTEFKIGQNVFYLPHNRFKAEGRYVVMRFLLPRGTKVGALHHQKPKDDAGARIHSRGTELRKAPSGRGAWGLNAVSTLRLG